MKHSLGTVLVGVSAAAVRKRKREQLIEAAGVQVGNGKRGTLTELPLGAGGRLHNVGRSQAGIHFVDHGRVLGGAQVAFRGVGKTSRIRDHILLLSDAVEPLRLQNLANRETVIEHSETAAQHHFRRAAAPSDSPGDAKARGQVETIIDAALSFIADARADSDVGADAPVILKIQTCINIGHRRPRTADGDRELRGVGRAHGLQLLQGALIGERSGGHST